MPAKGGSKNCCCGGCGRPLISEPYFHAAQFCAACQPYQICAELQCGALAPCSGYQTYTAVLSLPFSCADLPDTSRVRWTGVMLRADQQVHIAVVPITDEASGKCYLSLTSAELGVNDLRVAIDSANGIWNTTCQGCASPCDAPFAEFTFTDYLCGGTATLGLRAAANTSLLKLPVAYGCASPFTDPYAFCGGPCVDCTCLCSNAMLTIVDDQGASQSPGSLSGHTYTFANGYKVVLDCCNLQLVLPDGSTPAGGVAVGVLAGNICPTPTATWRYADPAQYDVNNLRTVVFDCLGCDGLPLRIASGGCPPMPPVLRCEVIFTPNCLCSNLGPCDVIFDLVYGAVSPGIWSGQWDGCQEASTPAWAIGQIKVTAGCSANGPAAATCTLGGIPIGALSPIGSPTFDPVFGQFGVSGTLTWNVGPNGWCGLSTGPLGPPVSEGYNLTVNVME